MGTRRPSPRWTILGVFVPFPLALRSSLLNLPGAADTWEALRSVLGLVDNGTAGLGGVGGVYERRERLLMEEEVCCDPRVEEDEMVTDMI